MGRHLRQRIATLSEEGILGIAKEISNHQFLISLLVADGETRHRISKILSEAGQSQVLQDLNKLTQSLEKAWSEKHLKTDLI